MTCRLALLLLLLGGYLKKSRLPAVIFMRGFHNGACQCRSVHWRRTRGKIATGGFKTAGRKGVSLPM